MKRAFAAEWTRVMRPGYVIGFGGVIVGLSVVLTAVGIVAMTHFESPEGASSTSALEGPQGAVVPLFLSLGILGTAGLVLGALATASDYSQGTLRVMLVAHPRRWTYLAGKTLGLWAFVGLLVVVAVVLQVLVAAAVLKAQGADLSAWWSADAIGDNLGAVGRAMATILSRVLWGVLLATLLRSAAAAIGIGIGYDLLIDPILPLLLRDSAMFLPGRVLAAWMNGGTDDLSLWAAGALVAVYAAAFAALAMFVFERRDVAV